MFQISQDLLKLFYMMEIHDLLRSMIQKIIKNISNLKTSLKKKTWKIQDFCQNLPSLSTIPILKGTLGWRVIIPLGPTSKAGFWTKTNNEFIIIQKLHSPPFLQPERKYCPLGGGAGRGPLGEGFHPFLRRKENIAIIINL